MEIAGHKSGNDAASVIVFMSFQQPQKNGDDGGPCVNCVMLLALGAFVFLNRHGHL